MNLTFWNVRGLNKSSKQQLVKHHMLQYHASFLSLLETKIKGSLLPVVAKKIANSWSWISNAGVSGKARIFILWDTKILDAQVIASSDQHITCLVKSLDDLLECVISSVYGHNHVEGRKALWTDLMQINHNIGDVPWLLCGDFNAMINCDEKLGGSALTEADTVYSKLKMLKVALKGLNKKHFHNISEQVQRARLTLENVQEKL
ncbi:uncharacterized protein LOC109845653 [Asparagus officinalis]|uniref:uncharacterized protein LOC109845653 n=1 Tax=Asparagus officinalis TaxID=4686 RepID=UPI00098E1C2E|nr:uncharacterized protein LOC109845653 [Asparagus officinalis]